MVLQLTTAWIDLDTGRVARPDAEEVRLTSTERALLAYLAAHPDEDLARERLLADVWGYREGISTRTLDTTVKTLRRKIEVDPRRPNHIHTVWGTGYRFSAPPARRRPVDLVGRDDLVDALRAALDAGARLVTLTGPGGVGKTRLVDEATRDRAGVCFVPVADAADEAGIEAAVAERLPGGSGGSLVARLAAAQPLLVLDNLEQVIEPARALVSAWLRDLPKLQVVATSRAPLRDPAEQLLEVTPLPPADALALFRRRVRPLRPELAEAPDDALSGIVDALDGLPLAIELAAGRALVLTAEELRERLHAPSFLRRRDGEPRHRSIEAVVQWSWDLLSEAQQEALSACATFAGPFTATDAEAVIGGSGDAIEVIEALFEASLVHRADGRLGVLDLVRRFAAARSRGPDALWARHAVYVVAAAEAGPAARRRWSPDLRAIVARAVPPDLVCRAALALSSAYARTLPTARAAVAELAVEAAIRSGRRTLRADAEAERGAARLALSTSTFEDHAAALGHALRVRDPVREARALAHLGSYFRVRGQLEGAERWLGEALALLEAGGSNSEQAVLLAELALVERMLGRPRAALARYERAIERYAAAGDDAGAAMSMQRAGVCHLGLGDQGEAWAWVTRALERSEALGSRSSVLVAHGSLAWIELEAGRTASAIARLERMAGWLTDHGTLLHRVLILSNLGVAWLEAGSPEEARRHAAMALELSDQRPGYVAEAQAHLVQAMVALATEPSSAGAALERAVERCRRSHPGGSHRSVELVFSLGYRSAVAPDGAADAEEAARVAAEVGDHAAVRFVEVLQSRGAPEALQALDDVEGWLHARRLRRLLLG
jgi:predicted ATPase/DNA-binding winged helix-turn-helix (wHTH) protein